MRMTGPSMDPMGLLIGLIIGLIIGLLICEPNKLLTYITTEITKRIRMMQQIVYPPVVTVSDVKFLMVMVSTMIEMINSMMNSYMYDRLT